MNFPNKIDKEANLWLIKSNEGLTEVEKQELEEWKKNKQHSDLFTKNQEIIQDCLSLDADFIKEMESEIIIQKKKSNVFYETRYIAASIIVTCVLLFGSFKINNYFKPSYSQNFSSLNEKILNISLPDNTIVDLDVKSKIEIKYYNTKRTVLLDNGKVLFWVAKNKNRPFIIKSGNTSIEVLGTKFEVIKNNNTTKINVLEGLVRIDHIYNENGDRRAILQLKKSESLTLNNLGKVLDYDTININDIANWKHDIIKFHKTSLKVASLMFERYSNQKVIFGSYELSQLTISGKFSTSHFQSFLESIQLIYPIKIIKEKNFIKIVKNEE